MVEREITTDDEGAAQIESQLPVGAYKAVFTTVDPNGNAVTAEENLLVIDPTEQTFGVKIPDHFAARKSSWQPGETFEAIWGTGYEQGRAWVEIFHKGKCVKSFWSSPDSTALSIKFPIEEKHRGGLSLSVTYVRDNRMYSHQHPITVAWENKKLSVKWEHFVSKLQPGGRETWTAIITPPETNQSHDSGAAAQLAAIEMVAAMYDSSLDQFSPHAWQQTLGNFYSDYYHRVPQFTNALGAFRALAHVRTPRNKAGSRYYRRFKTELSPQRRSKQRMMGMYGRASGMREVDAMAPMMSAPMMDANEGLETVNYAVSALAKSSKSLSSKRDEDASGMDRQDTPPADLSKVAIRKNLNETAFFFPNLTSDKDGKVHIEFEVPEALTTWKFMGLAHDAELRTGMLVDEMTTSKDLMVQPNPPRFLREGDQILFPIKVVNQSDQPQSGSVQLLLKDLFNEDDLNEKFGKSSFQRSFEVPAKESRTYTFELNVPDFVGAVVYKAVAGNAVVADGEEGYLPVLSKRILVNESLPLPIRGNQT